MLGAMILPSFEPIAKPFPADALTVLLVGRRDDAPFVVGADDLLDDETRASLSSTLDLIGFAGKADDHRVVAIRRGGADAAVALVGIGSAELDAKTLRRAGGRVGRAADGSRALSFAVPRLDEAALEALLTGFALGAYRFDAYRTADRDERDAAPRRASVVVAPGIEAAEAAERAISRVHAIASAVLLVRDLVNTPPNDLSPASFAELAAATAERLGLESRVWEEDELRADGFGGVLAVGQGSARPPRVVRIRHRPRGAARHVALVGKGITFDSGGLSIKPAGSMVSMKTDMAGAATVLGVVTALAALEAPIAVTGWLCLAENLPSGTATRPDDIITMRDGTTVEVTNTDAEGRLVLADGLVSAVAERPDAVIDVATLTGAQIIALGDRTTGVMGNDDEWIDRVVAASRAVDEAAWHMPIPEEVPAILSSPVADVLNSRPGSRAAGMLVAAAFLSRYVTPGALDEPAAEAVDEADADGAPGGAEEADAGARPADGDGRGAKAAEPTPWVHLDIAGPSFNSASPYGFTPKGATGVMVRTLVEALERVAASSEQPATDV